MNLNANIQLGFENNLMSQFTSFVGIDHITGDTFGDKLTYTKRVNNQGTSGFGRVENSRMRHTSMCSSRYQGSKKGNESKEVEHLSQSARRFRRMRDLNCVASQRCRLRRKRISSGKTNIKIQYLLS